jgi:hypothetical protein
MERKTLIRWADTREIVEVVMGIGEWDGVSDDDHLFFWVRPEEYAVGFTNGEWIILQTEKEETLGTWQLGRPTVEMNGEQVVIGTDHCGDRADFQLAKIQFVELYNGTVEPFYHITFNEAWCYSVAAKEILSDSSYKEIAIPGAWGATIVWLPIHHVK